ncbi:hypothetical protein BV25DRAFT_818783 [Artomyces pyxidatus]|uniref:Uncharacterized protein n=1 Tax=Artomyces pyxidatus TaxID=48021 RepID=A0ACB8SYP6_9AGAM|nr:hypothetical protein BV25DRAFT_818783 [Artomyces pyxidatus]
MPVPPCLPPYQTYLRARTPMASARVPRLRASPSRIAIATSRRKRQAAVANAPIHARPHTCRASASPSEQARILFANCPAIPSLQPRRLSRDRCPGPSPCRPSRPLCMCGGTHVPPPDVPRTHPVRPDVHTRPRCTLARGTRRSHRAPSSRRDVHRAPPPLDLRAPLAAAQAARAGVLCGFHVVTPGESAAHSRIRLGRICAPAPPGGVAVLYVFHANASLCRARAGVPPQRPRGEAPAGALPRAAFCVRSHQQTLPRRQQPVISPAFVARVEVKTVDWLGHSLVSARS